MKVVVILKGDMNHKYIALYRNILTSLLDNEGYFVEAYTEQAALSKVKSILDNPNEILQSSTDVFVLTTNQLTRDQYQLFDSLDLKLIQVVFTTPGVRIEDAIGEVRISGDVELSLVQRAPTYLLSSIKRYIESDINSPTWN